MSTAIKILICIVGYAAIRAFTSDTFQWGYIAGVFVMVLMGLVDSFVSGRKTV